MKKSEIPMPCPLKAILWRVCLHLFAHASFSLTASIQTATSDQYELFKNRGQYLLGGTTGSYTWHNVIYELSDCLFPVSMESQCERKITTLKIYFEM